MEDVKNGAMEIAEILSQELVVGSSPDHEILQTIAEYSLQLTVQQQMVLNRLYMLAQDPRVPASFKKDVEKFIPHYKETKRYHDTMQYIGRGVDALALRRFWNHQSMGGNVNITKQQ